MVSPFGGTGHPAERPCGERVQGRGSSVRRGARALTVLGSGDGAEHQQQERSPAERLHGWGGRRGAERPGEGPRGRGHRAALRARQQRRSGVSRPTGSAGAGGCAAPSRLRLHLGRAGGAAAAPPPGPPGALLNHGRPLLPPHLGETGWDRAGPAPGPAPTAPLLRNGQGERRCERRPGARPCPLFTWAVKPPRPGGGAAGRGCRGEPGDSCCLRRREESVSHRRELPGVFVL